MRIFGLRETIDPLLESIGSCNGFLPVFGSLSTSFLPNAHFQCCMLLQGTFGHDFDIFAASGVSTALVLLWKTFSAPNLIRVRGQWLCSGRKTRDVSHH